MTLADLPTVAAVVLAAGTSSRLGRNKLLVEIDGEPLVRRAARVAQEAGLRPVVVVLGHEAVRVQRALAGLACLQVVNSSFECGQTSSLRAGIRALPAAAGGAIMILADMPCVTAAMLARLVDVYRVRAPRVVLSKYGEVAAPPTLFDRCLFPELLALPDDRCPRLVVERHAGVAARVTWPAEALHDLDRPEDLSELATWKDTERR